MFDWLENRRLKYIISPFIALFIFLLYWVGSSYYLTFLIFFILTIFFIVFGSRFAESESSLPYPPPPPIASEEGKEASTMPLVTGPCPHAKEGYFYGMLKKFPHNQPFPKPCQECEHLLSCCGTKGM